MEQHGAYKHVFVSGIYVLKVSYGTEGKKYIDES